MIGWSKSNSIVAPVGISTGLPLSANSLIKPLPAPIAAAIAAPLPTSPSETAPIIVPANAPLPAPIAVDVV